MRNEFNTASDDVKIAPSRQKKVPKGHFYKCAAVTPNKG